MFHNIGSVADTFANPFGLGKGGESGGGLLTDIGDAFDKSANKVLGLGKGQGKGGVRVAGKKSKKSSKSSGNNGRKKRGEIVKEVMNARNVSLPQASHIVKQEGLYQPKGGGVLADNMEAFGKSFVPGI